MIHFVIIIIAYGIIVVGGIMILIEAFRAGVLWGIGSLVLPIISVIFVFTHWSTAKRGFLLQLLGFGILVAYLIFTHNAPL